MLTKILKSLYWHTYSKSVKELSLYSQDLLWNAWRLAGQPKGRWI